MLPTMCPCAGFLQAAQPCHSQWAAGSAACAEAKTSHTSRAVKVSMFLQCLLELPLNCMCSSGCQHHTHHAAFERQMWCCFYSAGTMRADAGTFQLLCMAAGVRQIYNLSAVCICEFLFDVLPRNCRAHSIQYVEELEAMSEDYSKGIHRVGDESAFMPGGFEVAALAAGGAITATEAVLEGKVENAYVLCRWVRMWAHVHEYPEWRLGVSLVHVVKLSCSCCYGRQLI